jgi:type IV pilus assembly protein PilM
VALFQRRTVAAQPASRASLFGYRHPALSRQRQTAVGIDVGAGQLKMVQVRWTRNGPRLENFALVPMPPGLVREGVITQPRELATLMHRLYADMNMGQANVGTTLGSPVVITRNVTLPARLEKGELSEAMRFEAPQQLPIGAPDLVYDYTEVESAEEKEQQVVFLAGTQKHVVDAVCTAFGGAKLKLQAIEMDTLAIFRALDLLGMRPLAPQEPIALLDMGEQAARLTVYNDTLPTFTRAIPTGLISLRMALSDALGMTREQAEQEMRRQSLLEGPLATVAGPWLRSLLDAVTRALEFFLIQHRGQAVRRLYVIGGGAMLAGVVDHMARELADAMHDRLPPGDRMRVQAVGLESMEVNPAAIPNLAGLGPLLVHALGSALREEVEA